MRVGVAQNRSLEFTKSFFRPFTFTVDTTKAGATTSTQYQLSTFSSGTYDFVVDWGDGSEDEITVWDAVETTHTYGVGGVKTIKITGLFTQWGSWSYKDIKKLLTIESYGDVIFNNIELSYATSFTGGMVDVPRFGGALPSMYNMFRRCSLFNESINNWDVSNIYSLSGAFEGCSIYNQPLNSLDLSSCNILAIAFKGAVAFNQPLNNWDVSSVTTMDQTFSGATSFNQDLSAWDVSLVTNMTNMLTGTSMTQANYDLLLIGWTGWSGGLGGSASKTVQSSVPFGIGTVPYTLGGDAQGAHDWLTGTKLWTMTDGGGI